MMTRRCLPASSRFCGRKLMDDVTVIGDDLYFNAYKIGAKPPRMSATEWHHVVEFLRSLSGEDNDQVYENGYDDGQRGNHRDGRRA